MPNDSHLSESVQKNRFFQVMSERSAVHCKKTSDHVVGDQVKAISRPSFHVVRVRSRCGWPLPKMRSQPRSMRMPPVSYGPQRRACRHLDFEQYVLTIIAGRKQFDRRVARPAHSRTI